MNTDDTDGLLPVPKLPAIVLSKATDPATGEVLSAKVPETAHPSWLSPILSKACPARIWRLLFEDRIQAMQTAQQNFAN